MRLKVRTCFSRAKAAGKGSLSGPDPLVDSVSRLVLVAEDDAQVVKPRDNLQVPLLHTQKDLRLWGDSFMPMSSTIASTTPICRSSASSSLGS